MSIEVGLKQKINERIDSMPAMPVIVQKMLALSLDTDEGEAQLLKLIAQDPQISAKIIGLSNTALFGAPGIISSVRDATMRLGLTLVKSISIGMATMSKMSEQSEGKIKSIDFWTHSMAVAIGMRVISRRMPPCKRPSDDQIFLTGLLHDIGYNVLSFIDTSTSDELHEKLSASPEMSLLDIEHEILGTHHGEIGAQLGLHWGLPTEIVSVIRNHHAPENTNSDIEQTLANLINISERILPVVGITEHTEQEVNEQDWGNLSIDMNEVEQIIEEVEAAAEQARELAISA